jgi:acyl-CoA thioester hydrolase
MMRDGGQHTMASEARIPDPVDETNDELLASQTPRFAAYFKVRHYEMDAYGHVNNAVYLHYLEQAAIEHSAAAGFPDERARELGGAWLVRKHEIEYLRPAAAGDLLQVVTWAVAFKGARAFRDYAIFRLEGASDDPLGLPADGFLPPDQSPTGDPLVRARTLWVWADRTSGRPRRIPAEMYPGFLGTPPAGE